MSQSLPYHCDFSFILTQPPFQKHAGLKISPLGELKPALASTYLKSLHNFFILSKIKAIIITIYRSKFKEKNTMTGGETKVWMLE